METARIEPARRILAAAKIGGLLLSPLLAAAAAWLLTVYLGGSGPIGFVYMMDRQYGMWGGPKYTLGLIPPYLPLRRGDRITVDVDATLDQGSARFIAWRRSELGVGAILGEHEFVGEVVDSGQTRLVYLVPQDGFYTIEPMLSVGRIKPECRRKGRDLLQQIFVPDVGCPTRAGSFSAHIRLDRTSRQLVSARPPP